MGRVRVVALTYGGAMGAEAAESELQAGRHALSPVYGASASVLAQIDRLQAAIDAAAGEAPDE